MVGPNTHLTIHVLHVGTGQTLNPSAKYLFSANAPRILQEYLYVTSPLVTGPALDARACRGGWRDVMINFSIAADAGRHICELQIAHKQMMTARKGLPGHAVYNRVRDALVHTVSLIQIQSRRPRPSRLP